MQLPRDAVRRYSALLDSIEGKSAEAVRRILVRFLGENPGADVAEIRDFCIEAMEATVGAYGDAAASAAADLFEAVMEAEGEGCAAVLWDGADTAAIEDAVRYQARLLSSDAPQVEQFVQRVSEAAGHYARWGANNTVAASVDAAQKAPSRADAGRPKVRWARIPTSATPCAYCAMLASRGFVYRNEKAAERSGHRNCSCTYMPGVQGRTTVEGYDPNYWLNYWAESGEEHLGLRSAMDPAADYYGPAEESNPRELADLISYLGDEGVELVGHPPNDESIGYSPASAGGGNARLHYTEGMSYLAWLHETDHYEKDKKLGFPGMAYYLREGIMAKCEEHAYGVEIEIAEKDGYTELVKQLQELLESERRRWE